MFEEIAIAFKSLRRNPSFAILSVLVLGIGIGATTTVFTAVDAVLFRSLPYPAADRIMMIVRSQGRGLGDSQNGVTYQFLQRNQRSFGAFAATAGGSGVNMVVDGQAAYVRALSVSSDYFRVFGFQPALGRSFAREDEDPGASPVAVLSDAFWRERFSGQADIVGRQVQIMSQAYTIIGIMPSSFRPFINTDIWLPLKTNDARGIGINYSVLGRLKDGIDIRQANAEMVALTTALLQETRAMPPRTTLGVQPLQKMLNSSVSETVLILFGAVLAMLLIVCANSAGLALVRTLNRGRELAVRAALGASRGEIVRQVLIETAMLSVIAALIGLLFARFGVQLLLALDPDTYVPWNLGIDLRVIAAVAASALLVGLAVGLFPASHSSRIDLRSRLMEESRQTAGSRITLWRQGLVVLEVGACMVLLSAAGLLIRSYINLQHVPLGFDGSHVVTAQISLQGTPNDSNSRTVSLLRDSLEQIRALPGVESAAIASNLPAQRGLNVTFRTTGGDLAAPDWRYVTPEYFALFRIPLRKGRYLQQTDQTGSTPVAVVNEEFVRQFLKDEPVLDRPLTFVNGRTTFSFNVVGIIGDVKSGNFTAAAAPTVFVTLSQAPPEMLATAHRYFPTNLVIRTAAGTDVANLPASINRTVHSLEPNLPLASTRTMDEIVGNALRGRRSQTVVLAVFAALALVTAASGIYGLISYSVMTRTREFGIRIALGAQYCGVITSIVRQGIALAAVGSALGLAGALLSSSLLRTYLFGVTAQDPWTLALTPLILVLVSALASTIPALRVLKVSPSIALRE